MIVQEIPPNSMFAAAPLDSAPTLPASSNELPVVVPALAHEETAAYEAPHASLLGRAQALARAMLGDRRSAYGASLLEQAQGCAAILQDLGVDETAQAAAYLVEPAELWPVSQIARDFDPVLAHLVERMRQIIRLGAAGGLVARAGDQTEMLRRMLLAMADDIRVVLLTLAARLQTLRYCAQTRQSPPEAISRETMAVLAPLANRLGLWQIKWELEDLAFRFLEPEAYRLLAGQLEERRAEREAFVAAAVERLQAALRQSGIDASVSGRPKHLYSIHVKMQAKRRGLEGIQDLRGLRVIVSTVAQCYAALDWVHRLWPAMASEYDDYIARPKPNGYRSLHTVVVASDGLPLEVQIRTQDMHQFAEYGVASHWRYKEKSQAGGGRGGSSVDLTIAWVRQLLAWQREVGQALGSGDAAQTRAASHIYALTPQARVIELPAGSTAIDFAYHVHSGLGHRCRGARVDGQLVPLNRPLQTGQTVEIVAAKEGAAEGPSRDWLNPALGYVASPRARTKVRQWFNALEMARDAALGRERIERVLQREGRTSLAFDELARRLGQSDVAAMFVSVAREEIGPRQIEEAARGVEPPAPVSGGGAIEPVPAQRRRHDGGSGPQGGGVLVVGIDSLMNQLAKCCRPVPPDAVAGFVTRGRGVSVHRQSCPTFARLGRDAPERVIETAWDPAAFSAGAEAGRRFPVELELRAQDRQGLLRDVSDVFARDRINVIAVNTQSRQQQALMRFTVEVTDAAQVSRTLAALRLVSGVHEVQRKQA